MIDGKRPLSVLYDCHGFSMEFGGVSRYYTEMLLRFPPDVHWQIAAHRTNNRYLQNEPFFVPPMRREFTGKDFSVRYLHGLNIRGVHRFFRVLRHIAPDFVHADALLNDRLFCKLSRQDNVDLIHLTEPHFFDYPWKRQVAGKPFVVTVVDLIPELIWGWDHIRPLRKAVLDAASGIIAISNFTKERIVEEYRIPEQKIRVVYLGADPISATSAPSPFSGKRYLLYVGRRHEIADYKNFPLFVKAVAPMLRADPELFLACTGKAFNEWDFALFRKEGIDEKAIHVFATDNQLANLFSHAEVFVYPSKMEGFGIPVLDAFAAGCPVVLANCSCFPEIAGDAALYFKEDDVESLRSTVKTVIENRSIRNDLVAKGFRRIRNFSWEKCARETLDFYQEVVKNHGRWAHRMFRPLRSIEFKRSILHCSDISLF